MTEEKLFGGIKYLIRFPIGYTEGERCPVLFFLHGAGSRGVDTSTLSVNPFFTLTEGHKNFPFVSVAPLCTRDTWFDMFEEITEFARFIYNEPYTDKSRFYGIGPSMGGYGTWQLAMSAPELFAAIVPICGGGMYWNAARLKNVPVWAHHGDSDTVVLPEESRKMVDAVNKNGGEATLTVYAGREHDSWTPVYQSTEVFSWLLLHKNKSEGAAKTALDGADAYG